MNKTKGTLWKILGIISIIIAIWIIALIWEVSLFGVGALIAWIKDHKIFDMDLIAIYFFILYIFVPIGFIISGIGMLRHKKWAIVLFIIAIILWGSFILSTSQTTTQ